MANPHGRPPRNGVRAERLTMYVHPDTRKALLDQVAETGRPVGEIVDGLVRRKTAPMAGGQSAERRGEAALPVMQAPAVPFYGLAKENGHRWKPEGKNGNRCVDCGALEKTVGRASRCPGKKEATDG